MKSLETKVILEPFWKAAKNILSSLEDNHYLYCRKIDIEFFKEKTLIYQDDNYEIPPMQKLDTEKKEVDENQVFLLFYRKNTLLKELLEKFDKTIKEHHIKNIFFFKVREIGMVFNDAFAAVTLLNVIFINEIYFNSKKFYF